MLLRGVLGFPIAFQNRFVSGAGSISGDALFAGLLR
jgi:hypothetical protein